MKKLPLAAVVAVFLSSGALAATITVQSTGDGPANAANCPGASCRLRDAIAAANDSDTINFSVTGVITFNSGELAIGKDLMIIGPGPLGLAVDGNNSTRVFHILSGKTVTISQLTIQHGSFTGAFSGGAGILNEHGTLTVNNCAISNNFAQATGTSNVEGGGILNSANGTPNASLTVLNCTINGNTAIASGAAGTGSGGGIGSDGNSGGTVTAVLTNSTISGNHVDGRNSNGAGISSSGSAGGGATLTVTSCTFSGNTVGPNGSGSAIIATGTASSANSIYNISQDVIGSIGSAGYNVGGNLFGPTDHPGDDPKIGPLQNIGGQLSVHVPLCGSPALDAGKNVLALCCDELGNQRTYDLPAVPNANGGDGTDVGAVESPIRIFGVSSAADSGAGTLRQAILDANASPGTDAIVMFVSPPAPIVLNSELLVTDCVDIQGPGASAQAVSGNNSTRVFHMSSGAAVSIYGLTIANGNAGANNGGGILNDHSTVSLESSVVANNAADSGGGIYNDGTINGGNSSASVSLSNSTISGNAVSNNGGGISNVATNFGATGGTSVTLNIRNSTLSNNTAATGGGIDNEAGGPGANGSVFVTNSTLSANSATNGGGINSFGSQGISFLTINNSTFSGNTASSLGGAIYNGTIPGFGGDAVLNTTSTIYNAGASGGTIFNLAFSSFSSSYNLASDNANSNLTGPGDIVNTNPQLGPLQNNGGSTATHALGENSPAREHGDPNFDPNAFNPPMTFDQRGSGFPRVLNRLDIGAYELPAPIALQRATSFAYHVVPPNPPFPPTFIPVEIDLPLSGNPGIECRNSDIGPAAGGVPGRHNIFFYFSNHIASIANASASCGPVTFFGTNGNPISVEFDGNACNGQYVTVTLNGLQDDYGQTLGSASVVVGLLLGDTSGDGDVNSTDVSQTRFRSGQSLATGNFRSDVSLDAAINSTDVSMVKSRSGTALPALPSSSSDLRSAQKRPNR
jgi:hypothetical protein